MVLRKRVHGCQPWTGPTYQEELDQERYPWTKQEKDSLGQSLGVSCSGFPVLFNSSRCVDADKRIWRRRSDGGKPVLLVFRRNFSFRLLYQTYDKPCYSLEHKQRVSNLLLKVICLFLPNWEKMHAIFAFLIVVKIKKKKPTKKSINQNKNRKLLNSNIQLL